MFIFQSAHISRLVAVALLTSLAACSGANFKGGSRGNDSPAAPPVAEPTPSVSPTPPVASPKIPYGSTCSDGQQAIGANVTFLIDNSSSNGATDCPSATQIGTEAQTPLMQCGAETNREKAVLSAFDILADASTRDGKDTAVSHISIVQFPAQVQNTTTNSRIETGARVVTYGWLRTSPSDANRSAIASAMQFSRDPYGSTPVGAAIESASNLFAAVANDGRARVVILVTDGEPTDRDPAAVANRATQLRQLGVEVITVFVTSGQTRADRQATHAQMLQAWEQESLKTQKHWYAGAYTSFEAYLNGLLGRNGEASLIQKLSGPVDVTCVDKPGVICDRQIVEVSSSNDLTKAFQQIIRTKAIKCQ